MNNASRVIRNIKKYFSPTPPSSYPVVLRSNETHRDIRGTVLFSYLEQPLIWQENDPRFLGHSNVWESRTIAKIFQELGYQVVAVNWKDQKFVPSTHFEIVFDIFKNLARWDPYLSKSTIKLIHCTGSDPYFQNAAEIRRVNEANARRNGNCTTKRSLTEPEWTYKSLEVADACSLIGNTHTLNTYPKKFIPKMRMVTVSASDIKKNIKKKETFVPDKREFLWFFGGGAVHKGLDLVLDVFRKNPELTLNVVGNIEKENDFLSMYREELTQTKNILYHGFLQPSSPEFQKILNDTFCFIAPSCSEGISPAVATCLHLGLYPIISRDTGITLPENCGIYLELSSIAEIESQALSVYKMPEIELIRQIQQTQERALQWYSRQAFYEQMKQYIFDILTDKNL